MKKVYQLPKWKRHSYRRSFRELAKLQEKEAQQHAENLARERARPKKSYAPLTASKKGHRRVIPVPEVFSLLKNVDEMLVFYQQVYSCASARKGVFLEMSSIKEITVDAILYTISFFDHLKNSLRFTNFGGNFPRNASISQILLQSSFFNYMSTNTWYNPDTSNILSVKSGQLVRGTVAKQVIDFSKAQLGRIGDVSTRSMYATLIECMVNTSHHAYAKRASQWKWWLMALPAQDGKKVHFAFLDNGRGIPATVRVNFKERLSQIIANTSMDSELIHSALKGEYRTRMKNRWRGKGLPKIYSYSQRNLIENLQIISNHGYVDCKAKQNTELQDKFHGTLIYWEFV